MPSLTAPRSRSGALGPALLVAALAAAPAAADSEAPGFELPSDPATVVVGLREIVTALADADRGPWLRLHADGRLLVHYPAYMQRAGDYSAQLSPQEVRDLVGTLVSDGLIDVDEEAARGGKRAAAAQRRAQGLVPVETFDANTVEIELRLARYRPAAGSGPERRDVARKLSWHALRADARHYPEVGEIQALARAHRLLVGLMERPDLVAVR